MKKRLFILLMLLCAQSCLLAAAEQTVTEPVTVNEQLEINKNALLAGTDEQIRLKAASLMLDSGDPAARAEILQVLGRNENQNARLAVCQAIATSRGKKTIPNSEEFIGPLMSFLIEQRDPAPVRLAAEALLIFRYEQVEQALVATIADKSLPNEARLNAVQALRLQPDIRAIVRLIELLDDSDEQIVSAATEALKSLAIPVIDTDKATRRQMIEEIQRIGKEEFLHYWRMRQEYESQIEQLGSERDSWRQKYLAALDQLYGSLSADGPAKIEFLAQYLGGTRPEERLWAVSKISQWLHGTESKSNIRNVLGPLLINLIADENGQVRLNTARVLALMPELDSSQRLLAQLKVETDDEIRSEQFVALGQACRYAFSPQSPVKLDPAVRKETLDMAVVYLLSDAPAKAQRGAEVIRNLLEYDDGFSEQEVSGFLDVLAERYKRNGIPSVLRGELLNSMSMLCGQSVYSNQAAKKFRQYFVAALTDEEDMVREAAVNGLININKSEAFRRLRTDFVNDKSVNIRKRIISLADEIGTTEDLDWLSEKMNSSAEEAGAWKAMLRIFETADSKLIGEWIEPLEQKKIPPVRMISFFEIAERKAQAENNTPLLNTARYKLAGLLAQTQQRDRAKEYYGDLIKTDKNAGHRDQLTAELLQLYLNDGQMNLAGSLITNRLLEDDLDQSCPIGQVLVNFIKSSPQQAEALINELQQIKLKGAGRKPMWQQLLHSLTEARPIDANSPAVTDAA